RAEGHIEAVGEALCTCQRSAGGCWRKICCMSTLQPLETQTDRDELRKPGLHRVSMPAQNAARNAIDRAPARAFIVLSLAYLAVTLILSSLKLLWLDELITLHIARLPNVGAIWQALQRGVDPNPPVTHVLVHFSRLVFGDHEFAYRLPAVGKLMVPKDEPAEVHQDVRH